MHKQLPGGFGNVQVVFKELVDGCEHFLIQFLRNGVTENLLDENSAQVNGKLVNQTSYSQCAVRHNILFRVENLANIQRHFRFLIGFGNVLKLRHHSTEGNLDVEHGFRIHHIHYGVGNIQKGVLGITILQGFNQNYIAFIHRGNVIAVLYGKHSFQKLCDNTVLFRFCFNQINQAGYTDLNVQLFSPVVDIH